MNNLAYGSPLRDRKAKSVPLVFFDGRGGLKTIAGMPTKAKSKAKTRLARFELAVTQIMQIGHSERVQQFTKLLVTCDYHTKPIIVPWAPIFRLQVPRQGPGILARLFKEPIKYFYFADATALTLLKISLSPSGRTILRALISRERERRTSRRADCTSLSLTL